MRNLFPEDFVSFKDLFQVKEALVISGHNSLAVVVLGIQQLFNVVFPAVV